MLQHLTHAESIHRRLRTLRKRLARIEKYETEPESLNPDQKEAISRKKEVVCSIKELEDLLPQISAVDAQIATEQQSFEAKIQKEAQETIEKAKQESLENECGRTTQLLKTLYVLNSLVPNISKIPVPVTEEQYAALSLFRTIISGVGSPLDNVNDFIENGRRCLDLYFQQSTEIFVNQLSYADLNVLVETLSSPPVVPKFVVLEPVVEEVVQVPEKTPVPVIKTAISFINPSEILEISPDIPQEPVVAVAAESEHVEKEIKPKRDGFKQGQKKGYYKAHREMKKEANQGKEEQKKRYPQKDQSRRTFKKINPPAASTTA